MTNILEEIVSYKKQVIQRQKKEMPQDKLVKLLREPLSKPRFKDKISQKGVHLIAEVKKSSPSAGVIREDFDFLFIAKAYEEGGASCISVLTEDEFFKGAIAHLDEIRQVVSLPLLRKDFIIDEYQIYESKVHGADAILLISALLDEEVLKKFVRIAQGLKLDTVVEVHFQEELDKVLASGSKIIGINARDLRDFSIDLNGLSKIFKKIPSDRLVICESGIKTLEDLGFIKSLGPNAVLIGEALIREKDVSAATKKFVDYLKVK